MAQLDPKTNTIIYNDKEQFENEYDAFGNKINTTTPMVDNPAGLETAIPNAANTPESPSAGIDGQSTNQVTLMDGLYKSSNFVTGSAGWQIDALGNAEFNNGIFRGSLSASTIDIGTGATSFHVDINGNMWLGATTFNPATNPFSVTSAGALSVIGGSISGSTITGAKIQTGITGDNILLEALSGIGTVQFRFNEGGPYAVIIGQFNDVTSFGEIDVAANNGSLFIGGNSSSGFGGIEFINGGIGLNGIFEMSWTGNDPTTLALDTNLRMNSDWLPFSDNNWNLGDGTYRWKLVRGTTITPGDLLFENGWKITENDRVDIPTSGLSFVNPEGKIIMVLTNEGFVKPLS